MWNTVMHLQNMKVWVLRLRSMRYVTPYEYFDKLDYCQAPPATLSTSCPCQSLNPASQVRTLANRMKQHLLLHGQVCSRDEQAEQRMFPNHAKYVQSGIHRVPRQQCSSSPRLHRIRLGC